MEEITFTLDKEKLIKALKCCNGEHTCSECPYFGNCYDGKVTEGALILVEELIEENKRLKAFKEYFDGLYERGLEVANWHLNGALEPFDNFYESAQEMLED